MKKTTWLLTLLASLVMADANARLTNLVYSADLGLWIGLDDTPEVKPTEEELFRRKMSESLPYNQGTIFYHQRRSLGQLAKVCDYVIVGTVTQFTVLPHRDTVAVWERDSNVSLSVRIEIVMFGTLPHTELTIPVHWPDDEKTPMAVHKNITHYWNWKKRPKVGDKLLIFLADEVIGEYIGNEFAFDFAWNSTNKSGSYHLVRENGGVRYLDTPESTTNYLDAVKGYLRELRGEKRDAERYYSLLCRLIQSPVRSIREDARSDLMYFVQYTPSFDSKRILSADCIDDAIKYWVSPTALQRPATDQKEQ